MRILIILGLLTVLSLPFRVRIFEALAWTLLTTPIWGYLLEPVLGVSSSTYYALLFLNLLGWCVIRRGELKESAYQDNNEMLTLGAFLVFYVIVYSLVLQWNEFTPIGERIRDYALLSSVIRSPITVTEPWLHGYGLNYYAYWYRFGHFISTLTNLTTADMYNQLQTLTFALYLTTIFRLTTRFLAWSTAAGVFAALLIGFGSNLDGVFNYLLAKDNWWGPSRVIAGAINEFPAWSLLLGDLHPHYLNLPMIPLLILLFLHITDAEKEKPSLITIIVGACAFLFTGALLVYNANAWEVPIWGLTLGGLCLLLCITHRKQFAELKKGFFEGLNYRFWIGIISALALAYSLWLSCKNIQPNPFPVTLVKTPIPRTTILELLLHWGIPVGALIVALLSAPLHLITPIAALTVTIATLITGEAYPFLWVALVLLTIRVVRECISTEQTKPSFALTYTLIGAAVILCLIPEYIFLDDPYGGENERMNTIFKIYSSNWFIFYLGAFALGREAISKFNISPIAKYTTMASILLVSTAFFCHTVSLRRTPQRTETAHLGSLADIAEEFPGGAETVLFLRTQPGTVVLEAQGNPYSWTSFVSTLADKDAFLGWANHVELLNRQYEEINRRKAITKEFYTDASCDRRKQILENEHIDYAILGSLEVKETPMAQTLDMSCLKELFSNGEYRVYGLR